MAGDSGGRDGVEGGMGCVLFVGWGAVKLRPPLPLGPFAGRGPEGAS